MTPHPAGTPPKKRWPKVRAAAALILLTALLGFAWRLHQPRPDGSRFRFARFGETSVIAVGKARPIQVAAELAGQGLTAKYGSIEEEAEQGLFLLREKSTLHVDVVAGKQPVVPHRLTYVLRDSNDRVIGQGRFRDAPHLNPGEAGVLQIV